MSDGLQTILGEQSVSVGYVFARVMKTHRNTLQEDHVESPQRIERIYQALRKQGLISRMKKLKCRPATQEEVMLIHTEEHWDRVEDIETMSPAEIIRTEEFYDQYSVYVSPGTTRAAGMSCGGVIDAALSVARGEVHRSFAIVRPPGHHAEPDDSMGFCFYNNVAVAAKAVQEQTNLKKILILDWDIHHGNGTHLAFEDDPSVLFISIHRYDDGDFYPCGELGGANSCGSGAGLGYSINIPWSEPGMGDGDYLYALDYIVIPIAKEYDPDLVIISAGFDAAEGDPLGECDVTPAGFAQMTYKLCQLAGGRVAVALEGGYNLESISASASAVVRVLLGERPPVISHLVVSDSATVDLLEVHREQSKYWRNCLKKY